MAEQFIGLMSGTSLDGVDGVLVDFTNGAMAVKAHAATAFPVWLRAELLALNSVDGDNELHRAALAANGIARSYATVVQRLLADAGIEASAVAAVGAHGQTVRHRPGEFDDTGYTIQINNPALLAELAGIRVVADFRSRDLAAGGQGAPLVPAFHRAIFGQATSSVAVLNIGGISNLSLLPAGSGAVLGFDCGPGNSLLDLWCQSHLGLPYDDGGKWAATGQVLDELLSRFLSEPYFSKAPPKSTGRDLFNPTWLSAHLGIGARNAADVQATLSELTASVCAAHVLRHGAGVDTLVVCGGGALNHDLLERMKARLPGVAVLSSAEKGLPPQQVEAAAFAWLARCTLRGEPGNIATVTGARGPRILGAIYPS